MENWYALRSKTNKEDVVWHHAQARGFETFYPRIRVRPVNPRARKVKPYFPGYLFVYADLVEVGTSVFDRMPDATGLVSFGGVPAAIDDVLIATLRRRVETLADGYGEMYPQLKTGDPVTIESGPLAGYKAIFDMRLPGRDRVRVLLQMLSSRSVPVELGIAQIKPQGNRWTEPRALGQHTPGI
ncbi:MAG: hypothetical protein M1546_26100 [Chloroflexi bacterium]|nr:hypothetical protein [Chloroflexota bacterium]